MHLFYAQVEISIFFATVQSERSQTNRESYFETNKKGLENMNSICHKDRHDDSKTLRRLTTKNMTLGTDKVNH